MASFGGTVKLTGESEYRKALTQITQNLRETSSALTLVDSQYSKNDTSIATVTAKNEKLNSILEKQKSAYNNLKASFDTIKSKYDEQVNAHNKLQKEYDDEVKELNKLEKEQGKSSEAYEKQKVKVADLAVELNKSQKNIDDNEIAMSKLRIQMNNAETSINKTANEMDNLGKETKQTGEGFTVFKGILADLGSKAIQSAIAGIKKLGSAVIDVGKQAIESYAEYEQLVGGVETLFKDSAKTVQNYANSAYKSAGLSANEYMETVTSFSASLISGLGGDTEKAAKIADMAIIDMSDNANKMGTSMEMITNAYQGFAKGNFQMLDNLKLGFGGTKEEMARLINESGVMGDTLITTGKNGNFATVSFDKMVEAIHKVQQNMGITGTTAKEASSTIQGSVNSMKSAWQNLLTAIADDTQDMGDLVNKFIDSVITAGSNLVPRIKKSVEGIKKLINSLIKDVFPKLKKEIPQLKPLIETFEWFIKNKSLVVNAVKLMVGAFAVAKIVNFSKALSDSVKGLIAIATATSAETLATNANTASKVANTTATVAGTTATSALTVATNLLNAAWKANPIGLVITGVTALIGVIGLLRSKTDEATQAQKAQSEAFKESAKDAEETSKAYDDFRATQQKQVDAGMTELSYLQSLKYELADLVDENGKVKDGYEARASFITSTLNDALGTEISMVDGVISNYDTLKTTLDEVMEKKKAQIILDSQESLYKEAINGQTEALKSLMEAEGNLQAKQSERKDLEQQLIEKQAELREAQIAEFGMSDIVTNQKMREVEAIKEKIKANDEDTSNLQTTYDTQKGLLEKYAYDIGQYETNMVLAHAGEYEKMSKVNWEYVQDYQKAGDAEKAQLEDQVRITETNLNLLKELKEKTGSDIYDQQIRDNENLLKQQQESLAKYNESTDRLLYDNKKSWIENSSAVLTELTGQKVEFKKVGDEQVQMFVDGIAQGKPMAEIQADKVVRGALNELDKQIEAQGAGENLLRGFINGESNSYIQQSAFSVARSFAGSILGNIKQKLGIASPSKETKKMGQYLIEGFGIGMEDEENSVLKQASNFGKSLLGSLNTGLSGAINTSAIGDIQASMSGLNSIGSRNLNITETKTDNFTNMVEAFKTALSQMKIEMDDEEMGKFVDKTVAKTIYS